MKYKKLLSTIAALALAVTSFANMAITANAAVGDATVLVNLDTTVAPYTSLDLTDTTEFDALQAAITANATGGSAITIGKNSANEDGMALSENWMKLHKNVGLNNVTALLDSTMLEGIGENDKVLVEFDLAYGKLSNRTVTVALSDGSTSITTFTLRAYDGNISENDLGISTTNWQFSNVPSTNSKIHFAYTVDYATNQITCTTTPYKNGAAQASSTTAAKDIGENTFNKLAITTNYDSTTDRVSLLNNIKISKIEGEAVSMENYTVQFKDGEGNDVKDPIIRSGVIDSDIELTADDIKDVAATAEKPKYIYVENDVDGKTVADDGSTVVTVTFREAESISYSVDNNVNDTVFSSGSGYEKDSVSVPYSKYILKDNDVYMAEHNSNTDYYRKTITFATPSPNNVTVEYTLQDIGEGVYYVEGEDKFTETSITNDSVRCSMGKGGDINLDTKTEITTLPAGKYKLYTGIWGGASGNACTYQFTAGENTVMFGAYNAVSVEGAKSETSSDEFELTEETTVYVTKTAAPRGSCIDYVLITKTDDVTKVHSVAVNTPVVGVEYADAIASITSDVTNVDDSKVYNFKPEADSATLTTVIINATKATADASKVLQITVSDDNTSAKGTYQVRKSDSQNNYYVVQFLANEAVTAGQITVDWVNPS